MMTRYYRFAGVSIAVSMPQDMFYDGEYRLAPFRISSVTPDWIFTFEKRNELSEPEGVPVVREPNMYFFDAGDHGIRYIGAYADDLERARIRMEYWENVGRAQVKTMEGREEISEKYILPCLAAEHLIARNNGFVFHCAYIDHNGKAILFTAPSGTGKSTQAELWKQHRSAEIINGDRAAVRLENGILLAEGIPFSGSSQYCENRSLPIEAIVYLEQAPQTTIRKLRGYEAFSKIWEGVSVNTWDKKDMELVSAVVQKAAAEIPMFHLSCTPDESAVIALEEALRKLVNP